jgi:hypothetical protein
VEYVAIGILEKKHGLSMVLSSKSCCFKMPYVLEIILIIVG